MKKKILIITGIIAVVSIATYFGNGKLIQGRLSSRQTPQLSKSMNNMCIKQDALDEKYQQLSESSSSEPTNSSSESRDGSSESTDTKISINTPTTPTSGSGRGMIENVNENETTTEDYTYEDESKNENPENYFDELADGSSTHPYYSFEDCGCRKGGTIFDKKIDENGFYQIKVCNLPDNFKCAPPEFRCPNGTTVDTIELEKVCKKQKVLQCFAANPKINEETSNMCSKLYYGYNNLQCVPQGDCEKYIKMSDKELYSYIKKNLFTPQPPEGMFDGGGVFGVNKKYKPKNDQEKKLFQEAKLIVDCSALYDVKLYQ